MKIVEDIDIFIVIKIIKAVTKKNNIRISNV